MGCAFCASGKLKKVRNLEAWEIVLQLVTAQDFLLNKHNETIRNIVVMGIGEPFDNLDNVNKFINIAKEDRGLQIGARKITVSTCGVVHQFEK